jgi:hypothetical protein
MSLFEKIFKYHEYKLQPQQPLIMFRLVFKRKVLSIQMTSGSLRTGIKERRIPKADKGTSYLVKAA